MFVGVLNSPYVYGRTVLVETKTRYGAKKKVRKQGQTIQQLRRVKPEQADNLIMDGTAKEIYM